MALIVITISDDPSGDAQVGVLSEPPFDTTMAPTAAQACAMTMLAALDAEPAKEPGRIALLS